MVTSHVDVWEELSLVDAPDVAVQWSRRFEDDAGAAWEECPTAPWVAWLVPVSRISLNTLVAALIDLNDFVGQSYSVQQKVVEEGLNTAALSLEREAWADDLAAASKACEEIAKDSPTGFRQSSEPGYEHVARAAAMTAQAAEWLLTARLAAEGDRLRDAQDSARRFGAGPDIFVRKEPEVFLKPWAVEEPSETDRSRIPVVAAASEAASQLHKARELRNKDRDPDELHSELAEAFRTAIEAYLS